MAVLHTPLTKPTTYLLMIYVLNVFVDLWNRPKYQIKLVFWMLRLVRIDQTHITYIGGSLVVLSWPRTHQKCWGGENIWFSSSVWSSCNSWFSELDCVLVTIGNDNKSNHALFSLCQIPFLTTNPNIEFLWFGLVDITNCIMLWTNSY